MSPVVEQVLSCCRQSVGGILLQRDSNTKVLDTVSLLSVKVKPHLRSYSALQLEAPVIVLAPEKFHDHLYQHPHRVHVLSDHNHRMFLSHMQNYSRRLQSWAPPVQRLYLDVRHCQWVDTFTDALPWGSTSAVAWDAVEVHLFSFVGTAEKGEGSCPISFACFFHFPGNFRTFASVREFQKLQSCETQPWNFGQVAAQLQLSHRPIFPSFHPSASYSCQYCCYLEGRGSSGTSPTIFITIPFCLHPALGPIYGNVGTFPRQKLVVKGTWTVGFS